MSHKCASLTAKCEPCQMKVKTGSKYCFHHREKHQTNKKVCEEKRKPRSRRAKSPSPQRKAKKVQQQKRKASTPKGRKRTSSPKTQAEEPAGFMNFINAGVNNWLEGNPGLIRGVEGVPKKRKSSPKKAGKLLTEAQARDQGYKLAKKEVKEWAGKKLSKEGAQRLLRKYHDAQRSALENYLNEKKSGNVTKINAAHLRFEKAKALVNELIPYVNKQHPQGLGF